MKTTLTNHFGSGMMQGLAGVTAGRSRKQLLTEIVSTAFSSIDMAKGLSCRNDWSGAIAKLEAASILLEDAISVAETLPGVAMEKARKQAQLVKERLADVK